jgi:GNAT superfamily N-acetyltransferase
MHIEPFRRKHLPHLQTLINQHLSTVMPGWALPAPYILRHMYRNPSQPVINPWVTERLTLCMIERELVVGAVHLLHYGEGGTTGEYYRNTGDIARLLAWPGYDAAAVELLTAVHDQMRQRGITCIYAWDSHLPVPLFTGIPNQWPHILRLFETSGYAPVLERAEAIYGGTLDTIPPAGNTPLPDLTIRRWIRSDRGAAFSAILDDEEIGWCEYDSDLTKGGELPAFRGWAELSEMFIQEQWRGRGIGTWLVQHTAAWLRMAGCDHIALTVAIDDEQNGAGRFYQRLGWSPFTRFQQGWSVTLP